MEDADVVVVCLRDHLARGAAGHRPACRAYGAEGRACCACGRSGRSPSSSNPRPGARGEGLRRARAEPGPDGARGRALRRRGTRVVSVPHAGGTVHDPAVIARGDQWRPSDERVDEPRRDGTSAPTACRTSGARAAASGPRSTASRGRSTRAASRLDKVAVVSGIGCTGRVAGYCNVDSFHTTHGRAIPFATGLKLADPEHEGGGLLAATATCSPSAATTSSTPPAATST